MALEDKMFYVGMALLLIMVVAYILIGVSAYIYINFIEERLCRHLDNKFIKDWRNNSDYLMSINLNEEDRAKHIIEVIKLQDYYLQIYELSKDVEIYNGVKKLDELKNFVIIMSINDSDSIRYISSESNKNIRKLLELYKKYVAIQSKSNKRNLFGESELYIQALTDPIKEMIAYIYKEEKSKWINDSIEYDNKIVSNRTIKDFKKRAALIKYMRENEMSEYPLNMEETIKLK